MYMLHLALNTIRLHTLSLLNLHLFACVANNCNLFYSCVGWVDTQYPLLNTNNTSTWHTICIYRLKFEQILLICNGERKTVCLVH